MACSIGKPQFRRTHHKKYFHQFIGENSILSADNSMSRNMWFLLLFWHELNPRRYEMAENSFMNIEWCVMRDACRTTWIWIYLYSRAFCPKGIQMNFIRWISWLFIISQFFHWFYALDLATGVHSSLWAYSIEVIFISHCSRYQKRENDSKFQDNFFSMKQCGHYVNYVLLTKIEFYLNIMASLSTLGWKEFVFAMAFFANINRIIWIPFFFLPQHSDSCEQQFNAVLVWSWRS